MNWVNIPNGYWVCGGDEFYGMEGDTIIDSTSYSKIYLSSFGDTMFNAQLATYFCALREDSMKKVWVRNPSDTIDVLLYDFSLNVGDSVCLGYFGLGCVEQVSVVDSIMINGTYRRRIRFGGVVEAQEWIEGIGNYYGPFQLNMTGSNTTFLLCHKLDDSLIYNSYGSCHCQFLDAVEEFKSSETNVSVAPNPASNYVTFKITDKSELTYYVELYDLLGQQILNHSISSGERIDLSNYNPGIYLYNLKSDQTFVGSGKLIISP